MTVSDNTKQVKSRDNFRSISKETSAQSSKILLTKVIKSLGRTEEIEAKIGRSAISKNPKTALSTLPDVQDFD